MSHLFNCAGCGRRSARWACQPCWLRLPKPLRLLINGPWFLDRVEATTARDALQQARSIWASPDGR